MTKKELKGKIESCRYLNNDIRERATAWSGACFAGAIISMIAIVPIFIACFKMFDAHRPIWLGVFVGCGILDIMLIIFCLIHSSYFDRELQKCDEIDKLLDVEEKSLGDVTEEDNINQ